MSKILWKPSDAQIKRTNLVRFMQAVNDRFGIRLNTYRELHQWSVDRLEDFWASVWNFLDIQASRPYEKVLEEANKMPGANWFPGARLNFAENLLRYRDDQVALIFRGEDRERRVLTYRELYDEVARVAKSLRDHGVQPGDRVTGFMPNMPETVVAMLAAASIGAIWSSCSPDFGINGVLDRFGQIKPKVLFTADGYWFKGKRIDCLKRISSIIRELPSIEKVVIVSYTEKQPNIKSLANAVRYRDFRSPQSNLDISFEQLPFSHPLYIMYSSGTTGLPKCMVQSAGGVLINQLKELVLHSDLKRNEVIFYYTTCGWMMWNWLVSSLGVGARIVLYDGNPFHPDAGALWKMAQEEKIAVFGTSAGYITALINTGIKPGKQYDLSSLRAILSTGSPLSIEGFEFVYREVKSDIQLASISGGSDINGCFFLGNPIGPVHAGELQCRGLGMKVEAFDDQGKPIVNQLGELVCTAPVPSMPIYFWDDPDHAKYRAAYFNVYPNVWRHGDFIEIRDHGGIVITGRSDATLNPGGVRIGTADIYRVIERIPEVEDSLVIGQDWKNDVRVILFVKMRDNLELTEALTNRIKKLLRDEASPRHVPSKVFAVPDIPYTLNMKKVELAVKKVVQGQSVTNKDALKNPESLEYFAQLIELQRD